MLFDEEFEAKMKEMDKRLVADYNAYFRTHGRAIQDMLNETEEEGRKKGNIGRCNELKRFAEDLRSVLSQDETAFAIRVYESDSRNSAVAIILAAYYFMMDEELDLMKKMFQIATSVMLGSEKDFSILAFRV